MSNLISTFRAVIVACAFCQLLTGCMTIRNGKYQAVTIDSDPPGANVVIEPGNKEMKTPGVVELRRRSDYAVILEKEGFRRESVLLEGKIGGLWRNIVLLHPVSIVVGLIIDLSTGAAYELEPNSVSVTLMPLQQSESGEMIPE